MSEECPINKPNLIFGAGLAMVNVWYMYAAYTEMSLLAGLFSMGTWVIAAHLVLVMGVKATGACALSAEDACPLSIEVDKQTYVASYEHFNNLVGWVRSVLYVKKPFNTFVVNNFFLIGNRPLCSVTLTQLYSTMSAPALAVGYVNFWN